MEIKTGKLRRYNPKSDNSPSCRIYECSSLLNTFSCQLINQVKVIQYEDCGRGDLTLRNLRCVDSVAALLPLEMFGAAAQLGIFATTDNQLPHRRSPQPRISSLPDCSTPFPKQIDPPRFFYFAGPESFFKNRFGRQRSPPMLGHADTSTKQKK